MNRGRAIFNLKRRRASGVSRLGIIMSCGLASVLLLPGGSSTAFAQGTVHRCEVSVTDFNTDDKSRLGSFTINTKNVGLVTKAFRFPETNLFVTAAVLLTQEPPLAEGAPPTKIVMTLVLAKKAYSSIEGEMKKAADVISNARTTLSLKSFETAEVETIYLGKPEHVFITLECGK